MEYPRIRRGLSALRLTPLHPQWLAFRHRKGLLRRVGDLASGIVLDIGCADQEVKPYLDERKGYIGLDHYSTATHWYGSRPQIFGDAHDLPFPGSLIDCVLLLDVLEHLEQPERCLGEIYRVLKPGGLLIVQVPFLYPVHDKPQDYRRWTVFGLSRLLREHDFEIAEQETTGNPLETAALLLNIAMSKTVLQSMERKHPMAILAVILPILVALMNGAAWFTSLVGPRDDMMPFSYLMICRKGS